MQTLPFGLVPIVVPELKTITVGGAVAGCSIESMSYVHGGFHDTCLEYEVITAHGDVLTVHARERALADLPDDARLLRHGGHPLPARLPADPGQALRPPAARDTTLRSTATSSRSGRHFERRDVDFMDGIIHSLSHLVLCVGDFVGQAPLHQPLRLAQGLLPEHGQARPRTTCRPRTTSSATTAGSPTSTPSRSSRRLLLGKFLGSSQILRLAEKLRWFVLYDERPTSPSTPSCPSPGSRSSWSGTRRTSATSRSGASPTAGSTTTSGSPTASGEGIDDQLMIDIAIYGMKQRGRHNYYRLMEEKLQELNGIKTLDLLQLLPGRRVLGDLQPQELRCGQGDHRSRQHLPQPVPEDLPPLTPGQARQPRPDVA